MTLIFFKQFPSIKRALILRLYFVPMQSMLIDLLKLMANKWNKLT